MSYVRAFLEKNGSSRNARVVVQLVAAKITRRWPAFRDAVEILEAADVNERVLEQDFWDACDAARFYNYDRERVKKHADY